MNEERKKTNPMPSEILKNNCTIFDAKISPSQVTLYYFNTESSNFSNSRLKPLKCSYDIDINLEKFFEKRLNCISNINHDLCYELRTVP